MSETKVPEIDEVSKRHVALLRGVAYSGCGVTSGALADACGPGARDDAT